MTVSSRHIRRGTQKLFWVTSITSHAAPTVAEITAGTDLTPDVREVTGFDLVRDSRPVPTTDAYGSVITVTTGPRVLVPPRLTIYDEGSATTALRTTLADSNKGYVVFCLDGTPTVSDRASVWPVISMGPSITINNLAEAAVIHVSFLIWDLPDEEAVIA